MPTLIGTKLAYARYYIVEQGYRLLLVEPGSKEPLKVKGSHGIHDATTDLSVIEAGLAARPNANLAFDPGPDFLVLNFNYRYDGRELLGYLFDRLGAYVFNTPKVEKPTGPHFHYRNPGNLTGPDLSLPPKCAVEIQGIAPFAARRYALLPPSDHEPAPPFALDWFQYQWAQGQALWDLPHLAFPVELVEAIIAYRQQKSRETRQKSVVVPAINPTSATATATARRPNNGDDISEYTDRESNPLWVRAALAHMGIPFDPEKEGATCIYSPLRVDDKSKSGWIVRRDKGPYKGRYQYHDFGRHGPKRYYSITQLYAGWATGRGHPLRNLSGIQFALWQTRIRLHMGDVDPVPVSMCALPVDRPKSPKDAATMQAARIAWDGFRELLQCYSVYYGKVVPVSYTWKFCSYWTGLDQKQATSGMNWLRYHGYLVAVSAVTIGGRPTNLYLPGDGTQAGRYPKKDTISPI